MRAFREIVRFECRQQLGSPLFLLIAGTYAIWPILAISRWSAADFANHFNAPIEALRVATVVGGLFLMFPAVAFIATAITRDCELKTAEQFFVSGVGERTFVLARLTGALVPVIAIGALVLIGHGVGTLMPWVDREALGPISVAPYAYALAVIVLPNAVILGVLFIGVAALSRSLAACYVAAIVFFASFIVATSVTTSVLPEDAAWAALTDPFGNRAIFHETRYWTVAELNRDLPGGWLLTNRAVWLLVAAIALALLLYRYRFNPHPPGALRVWPRRRKARPDAPPLMPLKARRPFGATPVMAQLLSQLRIDLLAVTRSMPFYAMLTLTIIVVVLVALTGDERLDGTPQIPVTSIVTSFVRPQMTLLLAVILIYLSAELVHRERRTRVAELVDASPFPDGVGVASKIMALWLVAAAVLLAAMIAIAIVQTISRYTNYELGLSALQLFGGLGVWAALFGVLAVFVQVLAPNKWLGMLVVISIFLWAEFSARLGFEHFLVRFSLPELTHSDMNGYGHFTLPFVAISAYWAAFSLLLVVTAHLFHRRGLPDGVRQRISEARARLTAPAATVALTAALAWVGLGAWIYRSTNIVNDYMTADDLDSKSADFERRYKPYDNMNRLAYSAVELEVDLYPDERRLESRGRADVVNAEPHAIDETLLFVHPDLAEVTLELEQAELIEEDETQGVFRYAFDPPLAPGAGVDLRWRLTWRNPAFPNSRPNNEIVENGTFVDHDDVMPALGYESFRFRELTDSAARRKHGLPPADRLPELRDPEYLDVGLHGFQRRTDFRITVGTAGDKIAVAPGYLQREWAADGRRYFEYEMDEPIWPFFSVSSARYEVARDRWNAVAIEIYYDAKHPYNVERMIEGTKRSLDYFTREFSPYQYRHFRVLEFPGYRQFARAFPNTIPFSEAGFISDQRDETAVDFPFYVTAHETAHQWWGHQVAGALTPGVQVLTETLAQYSALMVMEDYYGEAMMRRFLKHELDGYLASRGTEALEELPLIDSERQAYIHYEKGSLVMYALKDLIGEDRVNLALRRFLDRYAFAPPPYPTARDLLAQFRAVAGSEHQNMITDWFERIVLYDLSVLEVESTPVDGGYEVRIVVSARQLDADGHGEETEVPLAAYLDIGVFPAGVGRLGRVDLPTPIYLEKHLIRSGEQTIVVRVAEEPARAGIDPYNKMIDRRPNDNLRAL